MTVRRATTRGLAGPPDRSPAICRTFAFWWCRRSDAPPSSRRDVDARAHVIEAPSGAERHPSAGDHTTMPIDFANAPPPTPVTGGIAVPVHIQDLRAIVTMDAARSSGDVEA